MATSAQFGWRNRKKWGGVPHGSFAHVLLGTDELGTWLHHPADADSPWASVALIPEAQWWTANWIIEDNQEHKVYVDITTPGVWDDTEVGFVDLEMDVERWADTGQTTLVDVDEFEERRQVCAYPDDVVSHARTTAERLFACVRDYQEPFSEVGREWIEQAPRAG